MVGLPKMNLETFLELSENYGATLINLDGKVAFPYYIRSLIVTQSDLWILAVTGSLYCILEGKWKKVLDNVARIRYRSDTSIIVLEVSSGKADFDSYYIHTIDDSLDSLKRVNVLPFIDITVDDRNQVLLVKDSQLYSKIRTIQVGEYIITSPNRGAKVRGFSNYKLSFGAYKLDNDHQLLLTQSFTNELKNENAGDYVDYEHELFLDNVSEYENNTYFGEGIDY
jgi:hypothetical protein